MRPFLFKEGQVYNTKIWVVKTTPGLATGLMHRAALTTPPTKDRIIFPAIFYIDRGDINTFNEYHIFVVVFREKFS